MHIRESAIILPAYIGIPGAVDLRKLIGISVRIEVGESLRFLVTHGNIASALVRRHGYSPGQLLEQLAPTLELPRNGVDGLHINTFNQVEKTEHWRQDMLRQTNRLEE